MIEDIYRLSPLQEGMLFESLYAPASATYVVQVTWTLDGDLDPAALRRAWEHLTARHAVLRTSFHWEELEQPHQVTHREVELPWVEEDWRGLAPGERERRLEERCEADRRAGFDLGTAPLFRLLLVRLEDGLWSHVWTQHHLLLDGWSVARSLQELLSAYSAFRRNETPRLPRVRPFRDYVEWLLRRDPREAEAFWRRELADFTSPTPLGGRPADRHAFGRRGFVEAALDAGETTALAELARRHRLTLNTFVQGAWALLLARRSGEEDIVFGVVVSGRPAAELPGVESAVGPFINTIPLRARLAADARLIPWLAALQERQLEARRFEHSPLVEVQGWSGVPRDRALFESLLAFEGSIYDPALGEGTDGVRVLDARNNQVSRAPVTVVAFPKGGKLDLSLAWDRDRFEAHEMARWIGHLVTLLRGMLADPERALADLPWLTEAERQQVVVEWPSPLSPLPVRPNPPSPGEGHPLPSTIHDLFLAQVERDPEAVAVVFGEERVTYGELAERSGRLAERLREMGVGPETRVAVALRRSPRLVETLLGILQAGGAYVPLDPDDPPERREWIAEDCGAAVVISEDWEGWGRPSPGEGGFGRTGRGDGGEGLAYVLYTSGTTGRPKGAMVTHRAVVNYLLWVQSVYPLRPEDAGLLKTPISFDVSVRELFWPLSVGARVVMARPGGERDPDHLLDLIACEGVRIASFVPSLLAAIAERDLPPVLERIITGAEVLPAELAERCLERFPRISLHNHYGPTETTVNATAWQCRPGERPVPIGRAIGNTWIDLVDAWGSPVPIGVAGELLVGGAGVGRGYLGRPDLTAERFVPDPSEPGARRYRTGDLARWRTDGALEFLGRIDHQIKVRGFRIEPEEIEAALVACPGVREAAVVARDGALIAYVVSGPEIHALRAALAERLPAALVPSVFVHVDALPRTASGKVDRRTLRDQVPSSPAEAGFEPPRTPIEEQIAAVWAEVLRRPQVSVHDDFFSLGGHSLLALQVASRLREAFGVEVPLRRIFEAPALSALAREVEAALQEGTGPAPPPLVPVPRDREIPLSFSQESLWLLHQLDPASPAYNVPAAVLVTGRLDAGALAHTLGEIVRRHEALRTSFPTRGGRPMQEIHPGGPVPLPVIDLRLDGAEEVRRIARDEALRPFDLARGPLLRAMLVRLAEEEHLFLLTLHHAVSDEWSVAVLVREVGAIYPALLEGEPSPLPELPVQVADHAVWQREWLRGEVLAARLAWWRELLAGAPPVIDLPLDRPRTAARSFRGGRVPLPISAATVERLRQQARERSASLFMALLAGVQAWLSREGAGEDLVTGVPVANRSHPGTEGLIGFFVNTLPLRADLSGDPGFGELVGRARETALGAFAHQDLPIETLVQELRPERTLSHAPLFQVMLALHNVPAPALELPGLSFRPMDADPGTAKFDLVLEMNEAATVLGSLEYAADLFDRTTAERLAGHLRVLLEAAAEDPDRPFSALPLLTAAESHQIAEWSAPRGSFPVACLHRLFEARAAERPDARAVDDLTYAELDRRSNQLARRLRGLGVGPETRVALRYGRTPDLIVGMLGILKAGGAYVPIDPAWPEERARWVLEDAGVAVVVDEELIPAEDGSPLGAPVLPENLAYVIYTSGSTGQPKGTLVTHANVARLLAATDPWFRFGPDDVWTLFHSAAFDFSAWEIWGALAHGGRLVIVPTDTARSPEDFRALLESERVTVLNQTPSAFRQLARLEPPPSLRWVIFGGEALDVGTVAGWLERVPLANMYGITETTVHVTFRPLSREDLGTPWRSPIGVPIPDLSVQLLAPVPVGVPGEICVGGAGVARGYLGRPDLTAERFVPGEAGSRLYRSGDLARRLPSGELEFLGRIDEQVKLRGFRIEPAEIEAALAAVPGVRDAAVILRSDLPAGPGLVAYVVREPGSEVSAGDLLTRLRGRLPDWMVPGRFVFLPALPLTSNGKLDRRALPAPEGERPELARVYVAPRTALEQVLAGAWEEALGVERVGIEDGFFDLGGHSLLATQMVSWVRETFEVELPLRELFERPTVAGLAAALTADPDVRARVERTAELLLQVSELSEEEVAGRIHGEDR